MEGQMALRGRDLIESVRAWLSVWRWPRSIVVEHLTEDQLFTRSIVDATARMMWDHRHSLSIEIDHDDTRAKGHCGPGERTHSITIPGGLTVQMMESRTKGATVISPDGEREDIKAPDMAVLWRTWVAIQCLAFLETMGTDEIDPSNDEESVREMRRRVAVMVGDAFAKTSARMATGKTEVYSKYLGIWVPGTSGWLDLDGLWVDLQVITDENGGSSTRRLLHPVVGAVHVPDEPISAGMKRRKRSSFENALGIADALPRHQPAPRGNAQAARIVKLCRDALVEDPEMVDGYGTPIAPLVDRHLPDLLQRHAQASAVALEEDLQRIDDELTVGLLHVRKVVMDALQVTASRRRDELHTQLGFLKLRHPQSLDEAGMIEWHE